MKPLGLFVIFIVPGCTAQENLKAQEKLPFPEKPEVRRSKEQHFFSACLPRLKAGLKNLSPGRFFPFITIPSPYHLRIKQASNRLLTGTSQAFKPVNPCIPPV